MVHGAGGEWSNFRRIRPFGIADVERTCPLRRSVPHAAPKGTVPILFGTIIANGQNDAIAMRNACATPKMYRLKSRGVGGDDPLVFLVVGSWFGSKYFGWSHPGRVPDYVFIFSFPYVFICIR